MADRKNGKGSGEDKPLVQSTVELNREGKEALHRPASAEATAVAALARLVELSYAAVAATRAAIDRVKDPSARRKLETQQAEQSEILRAAGELVRELGGVPPTAGESRAELPAGADAIAYAADDAAVLRACAQDYSHLARAFAEAAASVPAPASARVAELGARQERAARALAAL